MAIAVERQSETPKPEVSSFTVHRLDPQKNSLSTTMMCELAQIGRKYYPQREQAGRQLIPDLLHPLSAVVLLGDTKRFIIGYAYAILETYDSSAVVHEIAVDPDINEVGAVERMMTELEDELLKRGSPTMEGNFTVQNGYAGRIRRIYSDRIIETREDGHTHFLKINLKKAEKSNIIPFPISS